MTAPTVADARRHGGKRTWTGIVRGPRGGMVISECEHEHGSVSEALGCAAHMAAPTPRILAHGIGGGWDLRHEGCAPKCCEARATDVSDPHTLGRATGPAECDGCMGLLCESPLPMDFDRNAICEWCADDADGMVGP